MAREIDQIMQELEAAYAPQKKQYQEQISALPSYYQAQTAGLEQARQNAFQDIVRRANARGVVYSGAPIQEQQVYTGERYLPALANLSQQEGTQTFNLRQALNKIGETQRLSAEGIRQQELNREEAARQAEANRRAAAAAYGGFGSMGGGDNAPQAQLSPVEFALGLAKTRKNEALNRGNVQSGYREAVKNEIINSVGGQIDPATLNDIIYNQVFPNFWEGGKPQQQQNTPISITEAIRQGARVQPSQPRVVATNFGGRQGWGGTALGNIMGWR
tara:strand:+ start:419 stop:1240 length:822 start_codon:yes stop_codon:yes gene_type:complete